MEEKYFLNFKKTVLDETSAFLETLNITDYEEAVKLIEDTMASHGIVHVTGIGKPGHVANYIASLLSSTGTPAVFLHGTEAVHGSCGQLKEGDTVICISNSGETEEMKLTAKAVRDQGCKIIAVSGNPDSWLAQQSDTFLFAGVKAEGGPLDRAPISSILAEQITLQGLAVILQSRRGFSVEDYIKSHPAGALGKR